MLSLSTERPALDFELDGKPCSVPIELGLDETTDMAAAYKEASGPKGGSEDEVAGGMVLIRWFVKFASAYAPGVERLSFEAVSRLLGDWQAARKAASGATEGE